MANGQTKNGPPNELKADIDCVKKKVFDHNSCIILLPEGDDVRGSWSSYGKCWGPSIIHQLPLCHNNNHYVVCIERSTI